MISPRQLWLLLGALAAAVILVGWAAPSVLTILLGGATLALFLSFPVGQLARIMPRGLAVGVAFLVVLTLTIIGLTLIIPVLVEQLTALIGAIPQVSATTEDLLHDMLQSLHERGLLEREPQIVVDSLRAGLAGRLQDIVELILGDILAVLSNAILSLFQLFGMLFVAVYLLTAIERVQATIVGVTPARYRHDMEELLAESGRALSRYLGGLLLSALEQGLLVALALWLIGAPYALLFGVLTTLTAFIPYIGGLLAAIPAIMVALTQSPLTALLTTVAFVAVNQFDSTVVAPQLQGQALRVSPVVTFLAVVAGGQIVGPLGAVLALPFVGVLRVLYDFLAARLQVRQPSPPVIRTALVRDRRRGRSLPVRRRRRVDQAAQRAIVESAPLSPGARGGERQSDDEGLPEPPGDER